MLRAEYQGRWDYHLGKSEANCPYKKGTKAAALYIYAINAEAYQLKLLEQFKELLSRNER